MTLTPVALPALKLQAATPVAGIALVNGTPAGLLVWNVPNDGALHWFIVQGNINVTVAETGGALNYTATDPGGNALSASLSGGGLGLGTASLSAHLQVVGPGTVVAVNQSSALTAGAAVFWAVILGA